MDKFMAWDINGVISRLENYAYKLGCETINVESAADFDTAKKLARWTKDVEKAIKTLRKVEAYINANDAE